jgi:hypothetical protein
MPSDLNPPTPIEQAPDKLRLLARWHDIYDVTARGRDTAELAKLGDVQADLHHWADEIERRDWRLTALAAVIIALIYTGIGMAIGAMLW